MIWTEGEMFGKDGALALDGGGGPAEKPARPPGSEKPHVQGAVKTSFQGPEGSKWAVLREGTE